MVGTRQHAPFFDVHPRTGATIEVFYADRALETFGQVWRWLVLVGPPARLFASRPGDWSVCYELLSLSACDAAPRHRLTRS